VKKILAKVHLWATRNISFAGRAQLINTVIFGMIDYWASIFMLPSEVLDSITKICRIYLWEGSADSIASHGRTPVGQKHMVGWV